MYSTYMEERKPQMLFFTMAHAASTNGRLHTGGGQKDNRIFLRLVLSVVTVYIFALTMVINYMAAGGHNSLFKGSSIRETTEEFATLATPAYWTFQMWVVIHLFMGVWIAYITLLFVRNDGGSSEEKMYLTAPATRPHFLGLFVFNIILNAIWFILISNKNLTFSAIAVVVLAITVRLQLLDNYYAVYKDEEEMLHRHMHLDLWVYRHLFQNGLEAYAAWLSIVAVLYVTICFQYLDGDAPLQAALAPLFALGACMVIWFPVENCFKSVEPVLRYGFMHYAVLAFGFVGMLVGPSLPPVLPPAAAADPTAATGADVAAPASTDSGGLDHDVTVVHGVVSALLALSLVFLIARIAAIFARHRADPSYIQL